MSYSAFIKIYKRDITTDFFEKKTDIKRDQNNETFSNKQKTIDTKNKTSSPHIIRESKVKDNLRVCYKKYKYRKGICSGDEALDR